MSNNNNNSNNNRSNNHPARNIFGPIPNQQRTTNNRAQQPPAGADPNFLRNGRTSHPGQRRHQAAQVRNLSSEILSPVQLEDLRTDLRPEYQHGVPRGHYGNNLRLESHLAKRERKVIHQDLQRIVQRIETLELKVNHHHSSHQNERTIDKQGLIERIRNLEDKVADYNQELHAAVGSREELFSQVERLERQVLIPVPNNHREPLVKQVSTLRREHQDRIKLLEETRAISEREFDDNLVQTKINTEAINKIYEALLRKNVIDPLPPVNSDSSDNEEE